MCQTIAAKPGSPVGQFRECRSGCVVEKVVVDQFGRGIPRFLLKADAGQHGPGLEVGRRILGNHLLEQLYGSLWVVSPASRSLFDQRMRICRPEPPPAAACGNCHERDAQSQCQPSSQPRGGGCFTGHHVFRRRLVGACGCVLEAAHGSAHCGVRSAPASRPERRQPGCRQPEAGHAGRTGKSSLRRS